MKDFWLSSGHHLLERDAGGGFVVSDEFLKVYIARPELAPPPDAADDERAFHAALLADPRRKVSEKEIAALSDPDARENWKLLLDFRDRLLRHPTLEAAYVGMLKEDDDRTPPLFMNQLVHVILRNALDGCDDAYVLRAAELFFREQRLTVHDKTLIAADEETIAGIGDAPLSPLVSLAGLPAASEIDVLSNTNAATYWDRSDQFNMALDMTAGKRSLAALGEVIAAWIFHMLSIEVDIEPLTEIRDANLSWYVGLDAESARIADALWNGEELDDTAKSRVIGLFRLTFRDPGVVTEQLRGEPIYLLLAMTPERVLELKPQNLVMGLPVRRMETVT